MVLLEPQDVVEDGSDKSSPHQLYVERVESIQKNRKQQAVRHKELFKTNLYVQEGRLCEAHQQRYQAVNCEDYHSVLQKVGSFWRFIDQLGGLRLNCRLPLNLTLAMNHL